MICNEFECTFEYQPTWIRYTHGEWSTMLYGPWASFYRAMVMVDGEEKASEEMWSFFTDPISQLRLEKSDRLCSQAIASPHRGN